MRFSIILTSFISLVLLAQAQQQPPPNPPPGAQQQQMQPAGPAAAQAPDASSLSIDLAGAISRARQYSSQFLTASTAALLAREDRVQAKAALFPTFNALNQMIYTQGNGTPSGIFVSNDGVHVYNEQALVHAEVFSVTRRAEYSRAIAAEAAARARQDIAVRGLVATVVQNYYALIIAQRHFRNAARSVDEARTFADITRKQEAGGEAAHADVVKAQLQVQQRERELLDAENATARARIGLGVVIMPDLTSRYNIVDDLRPDAPLQPIEEFRLQAADNNPEIRAAQSALQQAGYAVRSAKGVYYPSLIVDYFWGINANVFGVHGPDDRHNLGSVVQGTVTVPVWNWGANQSRVRAAEIQRRQAEVDLSLTRRQLLGNIESFHLEAQTARAQVESLRSSLDLAGESLRLTLLRYEAGEATALEVVDAQSSLAAARNAFDDGLARYRLALANMQTLTGRF
jgi:outer membrane protein TolC